MSKEKQIEEMAKHCPCYDEGKCYYDDEAPEKCDMLCHYGTYAEILYNAGYRKQSEGEWLYSEKHCAYICSECEECAPVDDFRNQKLTKFCPDCGAKMKGGAE